MVVVAASISIVVGTSVIIIGTVTSPVLSYALIFFAFVSCSLDLTLLSFASAETFSFFVAVLSVFKEVVVESPFIDFVFLLIISFFVARIALAASGTTIFAPVVTLDSIGKMQRIRMRMSSFVRAE